MFQVSPIPAFQDNYIWLIKSPESQQVVVVDPGDAAPVEAYLKAHDLTLAAILITHHHPDHTGGVADLTAERTIPVYGPANSPFKGISRALRDGETINLFGHTLEIKATPGHTLDHICYFKPGTQPQLFCGDTLFLAGCGRLFEGTAEQMLDAMNYFQSLPEQTEVYCTHEYSLANLKFAAAVEPNNQAISTITAQCQALRSENQPTLPSHLITEQQINPFMRTAQDDVIAAAETFSGKTGLSQIEVLAAIREWKNQF
ncbi:hydroxyacylglutathione hydrolase [Neptuniibacter sp. CAU 1671]|uniref:hydroxyacylglutathione hydrolase n=1 Tax=Neptuniibacter sp. CAU 1671 TaxID=3032593 RepID=UPI0023D9E157|nr:hydroxyacylglutathione hydrolase [Neptuniibacter sp. CAU 1671]MDF2180844.1 hydroxyacylglutathione hydrolase [Neptuniibacter sp. CAU 1671]